VNAAGRVQICEKRTYTLERSCKVSTYYIALVILHNTDGCDCFSAHCQCVGEGQVYQSIACVLLSCVHLLLIMGCDVDRRQYGSVCPSCQPPLAMFHNNRLNMTMHPILDSKLLFNHIYNCLNNKIGTPCDIDGYNLPPGSPPPPVRGAHLKLMCLINIFFPFTTSNFQNR
jgi:hypothetical protein